MISVDRSLAVGLKPRTLIGLLRHRAQSEPERLAYCFLSDGKVEDERITYGELDQRAQAIAAMLQALNADDERALLLYPPGFDYVAAFFGCLYSGVVAVPAYPPRANRAQRLQSIAADAQATLALTTNSILERLSLSSAQKTGLEHLRWLATDSILAPDSNGQWSEPETLNEEALAYLQYTSGSTSAPKGVMVSHLNVLHNSAYIHYGFAHTPESVSLSWLPHFHDMGLIDGIIQPLYGGFPGLLMSPASFLQHPLSWLEAISRYRVTHSGGPNFAYDLCARRISKEQRAALDLSSWRVAYNGAEPVRAETLERFAEEFAPCGFHYKNFYPAYGLAEATLKVSGGLAEDAPAVCTLQASALEQNRIVEAAGDEQDVSTLVSSGSTALGTEVRIVHPELLVPCAPDEVGEIWVKGPGVAVGYWQRPEETERVFHAYLPETGEGPFLRTGDLGFVKDGELFVTGRLKDLIIIRGRNHYPQDIELTVAESHASLRPGGGAAFSVEIGGEERLVVAQEVEPRKQADWQSVITSVREAISEEFEVQPAAILLLKPGSIPKTSSGKVRRNDSRIKFLNGEWDVIAEWRASFGTGATGVAAPAPSSSSSAASLESWLQERLASMLGVQRGEIDLHCSLTRYGVDSLMAVELMHSIETSLGIVLPLAEFLQSPSLAELAARAAEQLSATSEAKRVAFAPSQSKLKTADAENGWHPLSHNQKSLWFLHHLAPESRAYNISFAARVSGELDTEALHRAFQSLVSRKASLRTSFAAAQDEPVQRVHEQAELFFHLEDACQWSEAKLCERLSLEAQHCFDLEHAPLLRVFLFRRSAAEHVLMLVAHHIIVDFWSLSVLMNELGAQYHAEVSGTQAALAPETFLYTDYVNWQRKFLESAEGAEQERYWQQELAGELPVLDLPLDHPRPAVQSHRGASVPLRLDAALTSKLKSLARSNDATLYMTLLAAFGALLYRHTGQREVLIGSPVSGRSSAQLSETVGYFVNPIVTRVRASDKVAFTELLAGVRETALRAFAHQDYPFDLLVKRLQPERDPSRSPLFQAMFALHKARETEDHALAAFALGEAGAQVNLGGLLLESMALDQRIAQFDLSLTMAEVNGELAASFEFCTDLFEAHTIQSLAEHFRVLLEAIASEPSKHLAELPLLTHGEREQLLSEWNETRKVLPPVRCVHDSFERQAAQRPDQIAVVCAGERLSYGELNRRANRLARHLRARGVGPNVLVALCVERSIEMLVGILGILKAGGAYVPLDPDYPQRRLAFMLKDTDAPFLLTQQKFSGSLPATTAQTIFLDTDWSNIAQESDANPETEVSADNLAYVIYTSGSTGEPKGVMIGHGSLAHYICAVTDELAITPQDRILQFASFSFDISVEEIFSCLTRGATLVLRDDEMTASPASTLRACRDHRLTVLNLPTAYWHQLSASLTPADWSHADTLRLVVIGSEKLQPERLSQWHAVAGQQVRLVDVYGPTEATIGSTMCDLTRLAGAAGSSRKISIGRPLRHAQAYILDARLEPVPVGVAGELHIGGLGLSQGYLNHPELTAQKFIPHPFSAGARLYKTGDLARFLPDGNIEFLGRLDEQVKVRGFRIELGEIERALVQHERVRDAVVVLREEKSEKRLVAYLMADFSNAPATHDLRRHLKERLPEYMLPSAFIFIDSLPLTPSGKVDTRALPAPDYARPELLSTFVAPQTELEQLLAHIWADVLKLERVGTGDNFFELGGDSILTIQVVARAQAAGLKLTAREMFKHPTVAELAAVTSAQPSAQADEGQVTGEVPLTPIQRWFFAQEFEAADHWNMALLLEAHGQLQADLLEQALTHLLSHHDALRMRVARESEGWRAFIKEYAGEQFPLRIVDLSEVAEEKQPETIEAIAGDTQAQLSLTEGPLLRAVLFELGEGRAPRLLLVVHHLIIDGVSWGILLEDLASLCRQLQGGERRELPSKTTSFKTWAEHLERYARSADAQDALDYWTIPGTRKFKSLPVDYPGGANLEASTRTISVALSADETRTLLQEVPPVYHTQINDVLLTALVAAFERWTGERALLLELEGHGREELFAGVNLARTVGWFTSAFPVLLQLDDPFAPGKALMSIKEQLRAIPSGGINYGLLRYTDGAPKLAATLRSLPQPCVSFNYLGQVDRMLESASIFGLACESVGPTRDGRNRRTHLLEVNAGVFGGALRLDWSYSSELHNSATIERLSKDYVQALREMIEHCLLPGAGGYTPSDFPLAKLDQQKLDGLLKTVGPVTDIYPLSPMQQGMLFYSLYAPEAGMYIEQLSCALNAELNVAAFSQAWQQVAARHPILRTAFIWENLDEPLQVVQKDVLLTMEQQDWRGLSLAEQERLLESFLYEDRQRAFELSNAPVMRLALLRTASDSHRFIWTHHHLLLDGWSVALILREVLIAYETLCLGEELPAASASRPFRDYIAWLRKQETTKAELFWRAELKGFTRRTPLTAGWPAKSAEKVQPEVKKQEARFTTKETASLQAFARQSQLTLSTLVHGAFALLLSRYSMEDDVVFGTTVSGRPPALSGVDSIAGLFINTLPVRVQFSPETSARSWLKNLQAKLVNLRDYEYSSLVEVQGWSEVPREQALFESLLVFENYPVDAALLEQTGRLKLSDVRSFERTNYPLTIAALPGTELLLQALYANDRFDNSTIERLLGHLKNLLLDITMNPDESLADVRLLSEDERRRMLEEWNSTERPYPREESLQQLFEEQVELAPDAVAIVFGRERLTYRELNERANQLAHHLRSIGVTEEQPVGFMLERSVEMVVCILAILKAGGAYVPLDPSYPLTRLDFMLRDAQLSVVITERALLDKLPAFDGRVLCLDTEADRFAGESRENPVSRVTGEQTAYLIYTSGSTGEPKGISILHRGVTRLVRSTNYIEIQASDRIAQASSASFDAITFELWGALLNGAQLVIISKDVALSPDAFSTEIREKEISILFLTTALFNQMASLAPEAFSTVRHVMFGGEAVEPKWVRKVMLEAAPARLQHVYGPTESTTYATWYEVEEVSEDASTVPIGRPVANTQAYLLDSRLEPVAVGVAGELCIGGEGLARGYWRRADLTAERFIPHPFSRKPGERLYRTGDLARYRPGGQIEFLGRVDYQVKIRGFRIEPGEIEAVLSAHEMVGAAVVLAREDVAGERFLAAYLVPNERERSVTTGELRSYLRERLPEYMVPTAFVVLEAMPLTPNGKVDRRALPAPDDAGPQSGAEFVAPRNPVEEALADIWRGLLGVERIGVHDNVFELGGHSLMATRVLSNVRRIFRMELPLRVIFESNTIAGLALAIIPFETQPGQTEKIARVLQKVKGISAQDVSKELERKRRERNNQ